MLTGTDSVPGSLSKRRKVSDAYIAAVFGLLGVHHFYLGRKKFGLLYLFTLGLFGIGFIYDLYRMKQIVDHVNNPKHEILTSDVWIICLVLGPFGGHHFFLGNRGLGLYYVVTLGASGVGWIVDLLRTEQLVTEQCQFVNRASLATAYILSVPPFGILGPYHYYLGNTGRFLIYMSTFGVFGFGWAIDVIQMYILVAYARNITPRDKTVKRIAYCACVSPLGVFGAHHFILGRRWNGLLYLLTFGCFGVGWVLDIFRLPVLLDRYKDHDEHKYSDDAYVYWLPFGVFGLHQFYLGRTKWGIAYLCTFGVVFVGWVVDGFRMQRLVQEANQKIPGEAKHIFQCKRQSISEDGDSPEEIAFDSVSL